MRLLFIYIHKFGNIYQQGFNLSSDYDISFSFKYDSDKNAFHSPLLKIKDIKHNLPHLFNADIIDIKGVIGENGAGKTTLLRFLAFECHQHDVSFDNSDKSSKNILVYEIDKPNNKKSLKIIYGNY